jgi:hypothetical protein
MSKRLEIFCILGVYKGRFLRFCRFSICPFLCLGTTPSEQTGQPSGSGFLVLILDTEVGLPSVGRNVAQNAKETALLSLYLRC